MRRRGIYFKGTPANGDNKIMRIDAISPVGRKLPAVVDIPKRKGRPRKKEV